MVAQDRPKINPLFRGIVKQNKIKQANKKNSSKHKIPAQREVKRALGAGK